MSKIAWTTEKLLTTYLHRYEQYLDNVQFHELPKCRDSEFPVATVDLRDGRQLELTNRSARIKGRSIFRYSQVVRCHWISKDEDEAIRLKERHFDRLIIDRVLRFSVTLDGLKQAVFPLLRFFNEMAESPAE